MAAARRRRRKKNPPVEEPAPLPVEPVVAEEPPVPTAVSTRFLWGLFGAALLLRVLFLGHAELWGDEILFAQSALPPQSPLAVFKLHWDRFLAIGHVPFSAMVQNVWLWLMSLFLDDLMHQPLAQRIPAVLWGSATVPLFYLFSLKLLPKRLAQAATLMLLTFFFPVYYSREAYVYAPLMFLSVAVMHNLFGLLEPGGVTRRRSLLFFFSMVGISYCHLTGVLLPLVLVALGVVALLVNKYPLPGEPHDARKLCLRVTGLALGAAATVAPFYVQRLLQTSAHQWAGEPALWPSIDDFVGKLFMGVTVPAAVLAWVLLVSGLVAAWRAGPHLRNRRLLLAVALLASVFIFTAAMKTRYTARYLAVVAPFAYIFFTLGLAWLIDLLADKAMPRLQGLRDRAVLAVTGLFVLVQLFVLLPPGYALTSKSLDYKGLADWLVQNRPQGTAYVFESGYDQRFVPGTFPTPGLVGAVPYVHGPGPEEMAKLREAQRRFFTQFPESCYVEASRHGLEKKTSYGVWEWPHKFFRREEVFYNKPLKRLAELGVAPSYKRKPDSETAFFTPIWFNRPEDIEQVWRENGEAVLFHFDLWRIAQINQSTYARVANGSSAGIRVQNLRGAPVRGVFEIVGGMVAPEQAYNIEVRLGDQLIAQGQKWPGQLWSIQTQPVTVPPGQHTLQWGVAGAVGPDFKALMAVNTRFREVSKEEEAAAAANPPLVPYAPETAPVPGNIPLAPFKAE